MTSPAQYPPLQLYLHYFNYRWRRRANPQFDLHALIDEAADLGFSGLNLGVQNLPHLFLLNNDPAYLAEICSHMAERGLGLDTETMGVDLGNFATELETSRQLGAEYLRTYMLRSYEPREGGMPAHLMESFVTFLSGAALLAEEAGLTILLENHEDLTATEVVEVLERVNHPRVQALFDYGNSAIFMEEPLLSARRLGPYSRSAHLKDHVAIRAGVAGNEEPRWLGVPLGEGNLPILETTRILQAAGMTRVCFENCWAYDAPFLDRRGDGVMGEGAFAYREPPFDPQICLPGSHKSDLDLAAMEGEVMMTSLSWLERTFREGEITLARPLKLAAPNFVAPKPSLPSL